MSRISTAEYLGISPPSSDGTRTLPITHKTNGGGRGSLFGGVGLAAGVIALADAAGKPVVWATGQYVSTLFEPATLELTVDLPAVGRSVTQGRVSGHHGPAEIITVLGAAGARDEWYRASWDTAPDTAAPGACPDVGRRFEQPSIHHHTEVRIARGMFGFTGVGAPSGDNRTLLWARMPEVAPDAAMLAIVADFGPSAVGNALGQVVGITSLDNTIRYAEPIPAGTDWVLLDNRVEFVGNGFAKSTSMMWSGAGVLLATASQSMTVIPMPDVP